jgi:two-component system, chemotaxis family, response regulator Rcp1
MADSRRADILLVEDNPGDIRLITEALEETDIRPSVYIVRDGIEAMQFLRNEPPFERTPMPDIILLDLNLPRKDGKDVLKEIKSDPDLAITPVIVLSGSDAPQDVAVCYALHANCYVVKPRDLYGMNETVRSIVAFWLRTARLPSATSIRPKENTK